MEIRFHLYFCGMSEETFTEKIMIYQPNYSIERTYTAGDLERLGICTAGGLVEHMKQSQEIQENLGDWGLENFTWEHIYILHQDYMLGLDEDKSLEDICRYLNTDHLELAWFQVGGASLHNEMGYTFTVRSKEHNHQHLPHVHVSKDGAEARYALETLEPLDHLEQPLKRDDRKVIRPFLQKNQNLLKEMWRHNMNGYCTPALSEEGKQFYPES